ncbi:hypothetical protein [Pedobacter frigoris]|uniref:Uncharacterized protein n=1 Tax=Pedobacter frigoris TaxID=2571272 RepID=A0A4U1CPU2_9SPHI|nr:hypothetical protein [Pedobacter frigoris]TKC09544.1 hypothetical protein FA047_05495 [Pedobacter frigoris]
MENTQNKDLNPHEFTIEINGEPQAIRVEVTKPGDYVIYINGERTGHIYPIIGSTTLKWKSKDHISQELVDVIGKQIETLENNHL